VDGDGLRTTDEIVALRLNADWIVLSACNAGGTEERGAGAVFGLGRAFFYAGARSLLVSNFRYAHPIFWAPFTLIGDGGVATVVR
jgi:CHAT domain-containing protein